ncbi:hypothetical protein BX661DRAFT_183990 [Kickxella alabastrina]|uniref:uncharacterized protein n=1 Tax=Kickxella alabastrina TaxID=61397 RepID=UPI002220EA6A|nr:uncharacterized protein BX661DRAFT_183990 [Kickxella alabastrina]KAI7826416.1 hypothetical protein BX661DRAFT_183990 [Kickxella alabastrina]
MVPLSAPPSLSSFLIIPPIIGTLFPISLSKKSKIVLPAIRPAAAPANLPPRKLDAPVIIPNAGTKLTTGLNNAG